MIKIPTIKELNTSIISDIESTYGSNVPLFGKVILRVIAGVQAAKLKLYYLAIGFLQKNIWVDTADPESKGGALERYGRIKLGRNPFPAVAGEYTIQVTGTIGAVIKAGTTFKSNDDAVSPGKLFVLDAEYTLVATTDTINVRALASGLDSRLEIGDTLTVTAPIANVDSEAEVTAEVTEPLSSEDIETYRQRAIEAYRLEPQGGAATDYRLWAADAQGVKQTYPYAKSGSPGEIEIYVEATIADSTDGKGTPGTPILEAVEAVVEFDPDTSKPLNERGRRPLGVFSVDYLAVTIREVTIEIVGFVGVTTAQQTQILNAITAEISAIRPFISGADILEDKNDTLNKNKIISSIYQAIPGAAFTDINIELDTVPITSHTFTAGDIPNLDSISYS